VEAFDLAFEELFAVAAAFAIPAVVGVHADDHDEDAVIVAAGTWGPFGDDAAQAGTRT
jgi:hypothetical protein